jgi:hypothetical protein
MTVSNPINEFPPVDMDFLKSRTPAKKLEDVEDGCNAAVVSPSSSSIGPSVSASSSNSSVTSDLDEPLFTSSSADDIVRISDHKIAERDGLHAIEPLLRENPNRFVLFPIQDNDVSVVGFIHDKCRPIPIHQRANTRYPLSPLAPSSQ